MELREVTDGSIITYWARIRQNAFSAQERKLLHDWAVMWSRYNLIVISSRGRGDLQTGADRWLTTLLTLF